MNHVNRTKVRAGVCVIFLIHWLLSKMQEGSIKAPLTPIHVGVLIGKYLLICRITMNLKTY